jgi:hypothetical protein
LPQDIYQRFQYRDYTASAVLNDRELESIWKEEVVSDLSKYYHGICPEELGKTSGKNQDYSCHGKYSNKPPP